MNFVEPIRDRKKIAQIKNQLRGQRRYRDLLLFVVGINTALRISDFLQLKIGHLIDDHERVRQRFWIKEQKRNKRHEIVINTSIRDALNEYLAAYQGVTRSLENFVFFKTKTNAYSEAIKLGKAPHSNAGQDWKFIVNICQDVGLQGNYGTHSLRKTWGYHARMQGVDLALIMHKLNHESIAYTKRYLGITDDELPTVSQRVNL